MIIRNLREDEYTKSAKVISCAYSFKWEEQDEKKIFVPEYCFGAFEDDNETLMSVLYSVSLGARYFGEYIPCEGAGMIATLPMYRNRGCVRALFNAAFERMKQNGEVFSYIFPFSYSYYRKFGYEHIGEKYLITFPMRALDSVKSFGKGFIMDSENSFEAVKDIYNRYTANVECAFDRTQTMWDKKLTLSPYSCDLHTYIWQNDSGESKAYATIRLENKLLNVLDMAYTDCEGLMGIVGFLKTFYGRALEVKFTNVTPASPLRYIIREYSDSNGELSSWAMARVTDVKKALELAKYLQESGHFAVKVTDFLPWNNGIFDVSYGGGECDVTVRQEGDYDLAADIPIMTRILLGCDSFTPLLLSYCGCEIKGDVSDIFRVFTKRECYLNDSAI